MDTTRRTWLISLLSALGLGPLIRAIPKNQDVDQFLWEVPAPPYRYQIRFMTKDGVEFEPSPFLPGQRILSRSTDDLVFLGPEELIKIDEKGIHKLNPWNENAEPQRIHGLPFGYARMGRPPFPK